MSKTYEKVKLTIHEACHNGSITEEDKDRLLESLDSINESAQTKFYRNKDQIFDANTKKKEVTERMMRSSKTSPETKKKLREKHDSITDKIVEHHVKNPYRKYQYKGTELPDHYIDTKKALEKEVKVGKDAAKEKEEIRQKRVKDLETKNPFKRKKAKSLKASQEFLSQYMKDDDKIAKGSKALDILTAEKEAFKNATKGKSHVDEKMVKEINKANSRIKDAKTGGSGKRSIFDTIKKYLESTDFSDSDFVTEVLESYRDGNLTEELACEIIESI